MYRLAGPVWQRHTSIEGTSASWREVENRKTFSQHPYMKRAGREGATKPTVHMHCYPTWRPLCVGEHVCKHYGVMCKRTGKPSSAEHRTRLAGPFVAETRLSRALARLGVRSR